MDIDRRSAHDRPSRSPRARGEGPGPSLANDRSLAIRTIHEQGSASAREERGSGEIISLLRLDPFQHDEDQTVIGLGLEFGRTLVRGPDLEVGAKPQPILI